MSPRGVLLYRGLRAHAGPPLDDHDSVQRVLVRECPLWAQWRAESEGSYSASSLALLCRAQAIRELVELIWQDADHDVTMC